MAPSDWEDGEDEYEQEEDFDIEDDIDYEGIAQDAAERRALSDEHDSDASVQDDADGLDEDDHQSSVLQISLPQDQGAVNTIRNILFAAQSSQTSNRLEDVIQLLQAAGARTNRRPAWRTQARYPPSHFVYPPTTESQPSGIDLLLGGEYGIVGRNTRRPTGSRSSHNLAKILRGRQRSPRAVSKESLASDIRPNSGGTVVAKYHSAAYSGQYSPDSSFYYTCCRDFRLHVYDTSVPIRRGPPRSYEEHETTMKLLKTVHAPAESWTITDSHLSPDNERMIWASVTSTVYMTSTTSPDSTQIPISFQDPDRPSRNFGWGFGGDGCGIWSCRFSADGQEIVAGGDGKIFVYDLLADRRTVKIEAHDDDVNSCCWADSSSGNILISASDDTFLKVWDRRSLGSNPEPSGVLMGHTEGITYVSPKGDGRYVISNGKDQKLRLWDLRKMRSNLEYEAEKAHCYGVPHFDYRRDVYKGSKHSSHPKDCSVMEYHGHRVLRTLIRCHFSPIETTGQQYIYSGSADGRIHIWSLDGKVTDILDRKETLPSAFDPSEAIPPNFSAESEALCVRDVSWHSQEPVLMSAGWESHGGGSSIARHEWKGLLKRKGEGARRGELEDFVERRRSNSTRAERYPMPGRLSGYVDDDDDSDYVPENL